MALFKGQTTEWDEIQRRLGNIPESDDVLEERKSDEYRRVMAAVCGDGKYSLAADLVESLQHDNSDTELEAIRRNRLATFQNARDATTAVKQVSRSNFRELVTDSSANDRASLYVVCLSPGLAKSDKVLFNGMPCISKDIAVRCLVSWSSTSLPLKCLYGDSVDVISPNLPLESFPLVVLYFGGVCVGQLSRMTNESLLIDSIEGVVRDKKIIGTLKPSESNDDELLNEVRRRRNGNKKRGDSDCSSDDDGLLKRGYADMDFERRILGIRN